jgi:dTDP-4-amino-4,6-dideoxygalactose transaminase
LDLSAQFEGLRTEIMKNVGEVFSTHRYILGPLVERLEGQIASLCGVRHGVGVASGSDALLLSLMAAGVGSGDVVATTPFSFFATASAITRLGAVPLFVDVEPDSLNLDPARLPANPPSKLKAILPVHLYGQAARMGEILAWADRHGAAVVEDAAQAIGAVRDGRRAGSWGLAAGFSFYPTKNLGGAGDGGMIVTDSEAVAARLRSLRDHGAKRRYFHDEAGLNSRLDALQAAVLLAKMPHLEAWNAERRVLADQYRAGLASTPLQMPEEQEGAYHIYHQFVVRAPRRDELKAFLNEQGVYAEIFYPVPLHLQECFRFLGYQEGDLPVAEAAAREVLALPIFPELGEERLEYVIEKVWEFYGC